MASASYLQTSFLGGEWSPYYSGRMDDQRYRSALAVCRNAYPLEEGCWTRRPGTRYLGPTRNGAPAALREFHFNQAHPYVIEFTDGHMRFWSGPALVLDNLQSPVLQISAADPAQVTTLIPHGLATDDQIEFVVGTTPITQTFSSMMNRQWGVTVIDDQNFTLYDPITKAGVDGSTFALGGNIVAVSRVTDFITPFSFDQLANLRVVQAIDGQINQAIILTTKNFPLVLSVITQEDGVTGNFAEFDWPFQTQQESLVLVDGPYFDLINDGSVITPSAKTGFINFTVSYQTWSGSITYSIGDSVTSSGVSYTSTQNNNMGNTPVPGSAFWDANSGAQGVGPKGFQTSDLNRALRFFSEPLAYNSATTYAIGDNVKFGGSYYNALAISTGVQPDTNPTDWAITTTAAVWSWGFITAIVSSNEVTVLCLGGDIPYTNPIESWQVGLYSNTTGWPTCGCYHEGRLWLSGAQPNRYDGSAPNDIFNMAPTAQDGTVADSNAIAEELNAKDVNAILWMQSEGQGIIAGTQAGEWLIQASALNDPLTPTSIQAHKVTSFGVENIEPKQTPLSTVFVQRYAKREIEYISDVYSGKFSGTNIALTAKHLTAPGIAELAYQQESTPVVWARMVDGSLAGMTYKRESPFGTQPASFSGWHRHDLGSGRLVEAICAGPSQGGEVDSLTMVTNDPATGVRWVELLTDLFDEDTDITESWFVDGAVPPTYAAYDPSVTPNLVRLYGYEYLAGQNVDVWGAGLDLGTLAVSATGEIDVPIDVPGSLFTSSYLAQLTAEGNIFGFAGVTVNVTQGATEPPDVAEIQNFPLSGGNTGLTDGTYVDWDNKVAYVGTGGAGATTGNGYYKSDITTGALLGFTQGPAEAPVCANGIIGGDGNFYMAGDSSNYTGYFKLNPDTFAVISTIGDSSSLPSQSPPITGGFPAPQSICSITVGSANYIVIGGLFSLLNKISMFNSDTMTGLTYTEIGSPTILDSNYMVPAQNYDLSSSATQVVYVLSASSGDSTVAAGLLRLVFSTQEDGGTTVTLEEVGTMLPTVLGPGTLEFDRPVAFGDAMYDDSDGTLVIPIRMANTGGSIFTFLTKVSCVDFSIIWSTQIDEPVTASGHMTNSRIRNSRLAMVTAGAHENLIWVDTATGAIISTTQIVGVGWTSQVYNGETGDLVLFTSALSGATGQPTPIGGTPTTYSGRDAIFAGDNPPPIENFFGPFLAGYTFTSQGQMLRPIMPQETGARNGPALGKTRRTQEISLLLHRTQGISLGTDFDHLNPAPLTAYESGPPLSPLTLCSRVIWDKVDDDYSFDSQPCWEITRPYPGAVLAAEAFLNTQDR